MTYTSLSDRGLQATCTTSQATVSPENVSVVQKSGNLPLFGNGPFHAGAITVSWDAYAFDYDGEPHKGSEHASKDLRISR
jgi:hypothetical protein